MRALARLRTALAALGLADLPVSETVIDNAAHAAELGMLGSPTVLIDGTDPFTDGSATPSV